MGTARPVRRTSSGRCPSRRASGSESLLSGHPPPGPSKDTKHFRLSCRWRGRDKTRREFVCLAVKAPGGYRTVTVGSAPRRRSWSGPRGGSPAGRTGPRPCSQGRNADRGSREAVLLFIVSDGGGAFPRGELDLGEVICVVTERPRGVRALTRSKDSWNPDLEILRAELGNADTGQIPPPGRRRGALLPSFDPPVLDPLISCQQGFLTPWASKGWHQACTVPVEFLLEPVVPSVPSFLA